MTCNNCKYCEKCLESDRNYICVSFRKAEVTGKMLKVKNIQSKMILQVHDELIFEVIESEKKIVEEIVKRVMTSTTSLSVPLKVSADYGKNWYDIK